MSAYPFCALWLLFCVHARLRMQSICNAPRLLWCWHVFCCALWLLAFACSLCRTMSPVHYVVHLECHCVGLRIRFIHAGCCGVCMCNNSYTLTALVWLCNLNISCALAALVSKCVIRHALWHTFLDVWHTLSNVYNTHTSSETHRCQTIINCWSNK